MNMFSAFSKEGLASLAQSIETFGENIGNIVAPDAKEEGEEEEEEEAEEDEDADDFNEKVRRFFQQPGALKSTEEEEGGVPQSPSSMVEVNLDDRNSHDQEDEMSVQSYTSDSHDHTPQGSTDFLQGKLKTNRRNGSFTEGSLDRSDLEKKIHKRYRESLEQQMSAFGDSRRNMEQAYERRLTELQIECEHWRHRCLNFNLNSNSPDDGDDDDAAPSEAMRELEDRVRVLTTEKEELLKSVDQLATEVVHTDERIQTLTTENESLTHQVQFLSQQVQTQATAGSERVSEDLTSLRLKNGVLSFALEEERNSRLQLEQNLQDLQERLGDTEAQLSELEQAQGDKRREIERHVTVISQLTQSISEKDRDLQLTRQMSEKMSENQDLAEQVGQLEAEVSALESQLEEQGRLLRHHQQEHHQLTALLCGEGYSAGTEGTEEEMGLLRAAGRLQQQLVALRTEVGVLEEERQRVVAEMTGLAETEALKTQEAQRQTQEVTLKLNEALAQVEALQAERAKLDKWGSEEKESASVLKRKLQEQEESFSLLKNTLHETQEELAKTLETASKTQTELTAAQEQTKVLRNEMSEWKGRVDSLGSEKETLVTRQGELVESISSLKKQLADSETVGLNSREALIKAEKETAQIREVLDEREEAFKQAQSATTLELEYLKSALSETEALLEDLRAHEVQLQAEVLVMRQEKEALLAGQAGQTESEAALQELAEELTALKLELAERKAAETALSDTLTRTQAELNKTLENLSKTQEELTEIQTQLTDSHRTTENKSRECELLVQQLAQRAEEDRQKSEEMEKLGTALAKAREDRDYLEQLVGDSETQKEYFTQTISALKSELATLQQRQGEDEGGAAVWKRQLRDKEETAAMLKEALGQTQEQMARTLEESAKSHEECLRTREELARTQEKLILTESELTKTQGELVKAQSELVCIQDELQRTQTEMAEWESQNELNSTQEQLKVTQNELSETQEELSKTQSTLDGIQQEMTECKASLVGVEHERETWLTSQREFEQTISSLKNQLSESETAGLKLREALTKAEEEAMRKMDSLEQQIQQLLSTEAEMHTLKTSLTQTQVENAGLAAEVARLRADLAELTAEKQELWGQLVASGDTERQLRAEISASETGVLKLQEALTEAEQRMTRDQEGRLSVEDLQRKWEQAQTELRRLEGVQVDSEEALKACEELCWKHKAEAAELLFAYELEQKKVSDLERDLKETRGQVDGLWEENERLVSARQAEGGREGKRSVMGLVMPLLEQIFTETHQSSLRLLALRASLSGAEEGKRHRMEAALEEYRDRFSRTAAQVSRWLKGGTQGEPGPSNGEDEEGETEGGQVDGSFAHSVEMVADAAEALTQLVAGVEQDFNQNKSLLSEQNKKTQESTSAECESLKQQVNGLSVDLKRLRQELETKTQLLGQMEKTRKESEANLHKQFKNVEEAETKVFALKQQVSKAETENRQLHQVIAQLRQVRKNNKGETDSMAAERDDLKRLCSELESRCAVQTRTIGSLQEELTAAKQAFDSAALAQWEQQQTANKVKTETLERAYHEAKMRVSRLEKECYEKDSNLDRFHSDQLLLQKELGQREEEVKNLKNALRHLENEKSHELSKHLSDFKLKLKNMELHFQEQLQTRENEWLQTLAEERKTQESLRERAEEAFLFRRKAEVEFSNERRKIQKTLEQAVAQLNNSQQDVVDRALIANLIVSYFQRKRSREVLDLISRVLDFTEEQQVATGLRPPPVLNFPIVNSTGSVFSSILSSVVGAPPAQPVEVQGDSLAELWINYLLTQTDEDAKSENPATPQRESTKSLEGASDFSSDGKS